MWENRHCKNWKKNLIRMVLLPERKIFMFRIGLKKRKQPLKSVRRITDKNNNEWLVINSWRKPIGLPMG